MNLPTIRTLRGLLLSSCLAVVALGSAPLRSAELDFDRDVRPILSDKCYRCHGPDEEQRQADFRLDVREAVFADLGGYAAVVPSQPDESELIRRVLSEDPDERMPPPDSKIDLSAAERLLLKRWVEEGAAWSEHWSFAQPRKVDLPVVTDLSWVTNEIDHFILARLEQAYLRPSPPADRERLLRRVTIDLTGLPPTIAEIDAFLSDQTPGAYERVVERLLQSEACAERLALDWMDLARYADSHGLHADGWRRMWPWRDWVIEAFHKNMPYDQFVTWQIAGDLLPKKSHEQILATAFNRNHPMTAEGGVIDEEFRLLYVFDRVETTATAFLGLTIQCARCHDHKFDPITQREYYQLAAFYNNVRELGMTGDDGNYGPNLLLPSNEDREQLADLDERIAAAEVKLEQLGAEAERDFLTREDPVPGTETVSVPESRRFRLDAVAKVDDKQQWQFDQDEQATTSIEPELVEAIDGKGALIANEYGFLSLAGVGQFDTADAYSAALWIHPEQQLADVNRAALRTVLGTAGQKNQGWRGWEFDLDGENRLVLRLIHALPADLIDVRTAIALPIGEWTHVGFTYDGSGDAAGIRLYVGGIPADVIVRDNNLTRSVLPIQHAVDFPHDKERAVRVGRSYRSFTGEFGIYRGGVDDIRMWESELTAREMLTLVDSYGHQPDAGRAAPTERHDFEHWLPRNHQGYREAAETLRSLRGERFRLRSEISEIMVMSEMPEPRETFVLFRGEYNQPGEPVQPGTPKAVLELPDELPANRLGLARWLFHPDNSLTARVAVNRYWQMLFGNGLVRTPHDFGVQGARPTHPKLLDWLAVTFRDSGWDTRALLRRMVLSTTYRQSSVHRRELQQADPENRLLARSSSYRLPAEIIRDHALAASGLLVRKVGGPSVKPYQPAGLWIEKNNFSQYLMNYKPDVGDKLYRRSLYTFIRRTSPPPSMIALDAPNRSVCTVKREVTNTPLQALVLMNDPQFMEAARVMAVKIQRDSGGSLDGGISRAFRMLTGRRPRAAELTIFQRLYQSQFDRFTEDPSAAEALLGIGEFAHEETFGTTTTAAWTMLINTLMNYDEFYMKR